MPYNQDEKKRKYDPNRRTTMGRSAIQKRADRVLGDTYNRAVNVADTSLGGAGVRAIGRGVKGVASRLSEDRVRNRRFVRGNVSSEGNGRGPSPVKMASSHDTKALSPPRDMASTRRKASGSEARIPTTSKQTTSSTTLPPGVFQSYPGEEGSATYRVLPGGNEVLASRPKDDPRSLRIESGRAAESKRWNAAVAEDERAEALVGAEEKRRSDREWELTHFGPGSSGFKDFGGPETRLHYTSDQNKSIIDAYNAEVNAYRVNYGILPPAQAQAASGYATAGQTRTSTREIPADAAAARSHTAAQTRSVSATADRSEQVTSLSRDFAATSDPAERDQIRERIDVLQGGSRSASDRNAPMKLKIEAEETLNSAYDNYISNTNEDNPLPLTEWARQNMPASATVAFGKQQSAGGEIPPPDQRVDGKVYTAPGGKRGRWNGKSGTWEVM